MAILSNTLLITIAHKERHYINLLTGFVVLMGVTHHFYLFVMQMCSPDME